jgi:tetratricopeptide (TPR) repeat protein
MAGWWKTDRHLFVYLGLAVVTLAVFYQVHGFKFINLDDPGYIYKNPHIKDGITFHSIAWAFTSGYASNWHPLTWISHMLDWRLFGANPAGHHLVNLLFHIANTLFLFFVLNRMTKAFWQSAFVAALFALHPLHVESVAWVAERKDVLSTLFWLLTMWAYLRYVERPKIGDYLLIVVFLALGLMAKPMLVTLPFVLLLLDYWPLGRLAPAVSRQPKKQNKRLSLSYLVFEKIPLFAMAAASSIVTFIVQQKGGAMSDAEAYSFGVRLANAFIAYLQYIIKMLRPVGLAFFYPHPGTHVSLFFAAISAVLLLVATIVVIRFAPNHRYLATGWFWYLGTLVPVIGIIQVGDQAIADRYTYVPLTGLFIIIAWGLPELLAGWSCRRIALQSSALTVLTALTVCTYLQLPYWKNSLTLCQHALKVTRDNYLAHFNMTEMLMQLGRSDEAMRQNFEAVRIKPNFAPAINNLGDVLFGAGKTDEAAGYYERALALNPGIAEAHANLGIVLANRGNYDEAVKHFRAAAQVIDTPRIHTDLGSALLNLGRFDQAAREYEKVLRVEPNNAGAHNDLGVALFQMGKIDVAIAQFNRALQIDPNYAPVKDNLKKVLAEKQKLQIQPKT